jgi:hypothetical protein
MCLAVACGAAVDAHAGAIVFDADHVRVSTSAVLSGVPVAAYADFQTSGDTLTITLKNTSVDLGNAYLDTRGTTLTGILFDFALNALALAPVSATVPVGSSIIYAAGCSTGNCVGATNVGGEFAYKANLSAFGGFYGISSTNASSGPNFTTPNFGGSNLDNPAVVDGMNFGIVQATGFNPDPDENNPLTDFPLIQDSVVFTLTGAAGHHASELGNVTFMYGTQPANTLTECGAACAEQRDNLFEPGGATVLIPALMAVGAWRLRRRAA